MPQENRTDLSVAILIVSDTAYQDPQTDKSGDILSNVFQASQNLSWKIHEKAIVPDALHLIQRYIKRVASECNLIVTTGGTGFATKDVTPEAVDVLLDKKAPGLVHGMLTASLKVTPFAIMSRPVAGVYRGTVVVTLPGSPKGAKENLEAILPLLPHACMQAAGMDSRTLHAGGVQKLEKDAGIGSGSAAQYEARSDVSHRHAQHSHSHSQDHSHGKQYGHVVPIPHTRPGDRPQQSNDPLLGPSRRYRDSPYPLLQVEEAIFNIIKTVPAPKIVTKAVSPDLCHHILAEDVATKEDVPAFRASIADGYAIIASAETSSKGIFDVASVSHAAPSTIQALEPGKIARVTTGAPIPPNATAVVMVEDTVLHTATPDGKEELQVEILTSEIAPNENVREIGSDVALGEIVLRRGEALSPTGGELGLLASVGVREVRVYARPVVGVLSTGDEIVAPDRLGPLQLGEVRDCNRMTLLAAFRNWGYGVEDLGIGPDAPDALEARLREALGRCDVLVTTGGASMGERDLLKPVLERRLGAIIHFARVSMKPGKPTTFCTVNVKDSITGQTVSKPVFSLPGNPASAVVTSAVFVLPGLRTMAGIQLTRDSAGERSPDGLSTIEADVTAAVRRSGLPRVQVILQEAVRGDKTREEYVRAVVGFSSGRIVARSTGGQRSSRIGSLARANGLLVLPAGSGERPAGATVECLLIGQIEGEV